MVKIQLEKRGIKDKRVLRTMRETPRHLFIPKKFKDVAYEDSPLQESLPLDSAARSTSGN